MFSVLVADDEVPIIKWFRTKVDWAAHGLHLVASVTDGIAAVEAIHSLRPDIAILDIRMPGLNGLDVVEAVRRDRKQTRFVILSGYSSFEYAQRAIGMPVVRYLVKPLDESDLMGEMDGIVSELLERRRRRRRKSEVVSSLRSLVPLATRELVRNWLSDVQSGDAPVALRNLQQRAPYAMVIVIQPVDSQAASPVDRLQELDRSLFPGSNLVADCILEGRHVLIIRPEQRRALLERLHGLQRSIFSAVGVQILARASDVVKFSDIPNVARQMAASAELVSEHRADAETDVIDFRRSAVEVAQDLFRQQFALKHRPNNVLVEQMLLAVTINVSNPKLSLKWLAQNVVFGSADYLSKVFVRETGHRFSDYVTTIRMEIARVLLRRGDADTISDVARAVGYGANAQYFSSVFHQKSGVSPSDYRRGVSHV